VPASMQMPSGDDSARSVDPLGICGCFVLTRPRVDLNNREACFRSAVEGGFGVIRGGRPSSAGCSLFVSPAERRNSDGNKESRP
jgi:hypothetical protein